MQIRGNIKNIKATINADMQVTQQLTIEFVDDGALADLREYMEQPIIVTIESSQMKFGQKAEEAVR